jgi:DNA-binding CsgD family transcriptional regulator
MRRAAEARRRRQAIVELRVLEETVRYTVVTLSNGASPDQARQAMVDLSSELAVLARALRHLARLSPAERVRLARLWTGQGQPRVEVARRLGCSERTVWRWTGPGEPVPRRPEGSRRDRQLQAVALRAEGMSLRQVARELGCSPDTVWRDLADAAKRPG